MVDLCKECGANLAMVGIRHRCIPRNEGIAEGRKAAVGLSVSLSPKGQTRNLDRLDVRPKGGTVAPDTRQPAVGIEPRPSVIKKRGRPRLGEERAKPWLHTLPPMSKTTYYRRQQEALKSPGRTQKPVTLPSTPWDKDGEK